MAIKTTVSKFLVAAAALAATIQSDWRAHELLTVTWRRGGGGGDGQMTENVATDFYL